MDERSLAILATVFAVIAILAIVLLPPGLSVIVKVPEGKLGIVMSNDGTEITQFEHGIHFKHIWNDMQLIDGVVPDDLLTDKFIDETIELDEADVTIVPDVEEGESVGE